MEELSVNLIINEGIKKGLKNWLPIFVNCLLWSLTFWIPYLNVGTTIGLFYGLVPKIAKDEQLSYTEIFNPEYRKRMGEIFIAWPLIGGGIMIAFYFFIIPGIVLSIAWSLAYYLIVDKGLHPLDAIKQSNELTYGKKWVIFGGTFVLALLFVVAFAILILIMTALKGVGILVFLLGLIIMALFFIFQCVMMGASATVYKALVK